jgi:signal transduction histidine kinase
MTTQANGWMDAPGTREYFVDVAATVRAATARQLEERVKELALLHRVPSLLQEDKAPGTLLGELVGMLPAGWQYPELLEARITVAELVVSTRRFEITPWIQRAAFAIDDAPPGLVEVAYREAVPAGTDGPFLLEERSLLDSLALLLGFYFERVHRADERLELARARASQVEAEAANRRKDAFLATVSHELRRPLTVMLGWTQLLRENHTEDSERALDVIERNARIQLRLIEELLDLSRTATGQMGVTFSLVNLNLTLRNLADATRPAAAERQVEIVTELDGQDILVLGDAIRVQQIVGNLVTNAIKFTPPGGRVTLTLERSADEARVVVADTGIGIDPAVLPHIFERFWQADPSAQPARQGLGIGLSIVRRLVDLHGGTIEAESHGPGAGTSMTVTLPLAPASSIADATRAGPR